MFEHVTFLSSTLQQAITNAYLLRHSSLRVNPNGLPALLDSNVACTSFNMVSFCRWSLHAAWRLLTLIIDYHITIGILQRRSTKFQRTTSNSCCFVNELLIYVVKMKICNHANKRTKGWIYIVLWQADMYYRNLPLIITKTLTKKHCPIINISAHMLAQYGLTPL